jgi:hypothetical protein
MHILVLLFQGKISLFWRVSFDPILNPQPQIQILDPQPYAINPKP